MSHDRLNIIFDFDLTLISHESVLEVLNMSLKNQDDHLYQDVAGIGERAMSGDVSFREIWLILKAVRSIRRNHIEHYIEKTSSEIDPLLIETIERLRNQGVNLYVISSAYLEWVMPIAMSLGINWNNIHANSFIWHKEEAAFIKPSKLLLKSGKRSLVKMLKKRGEIKGKTIIIGDSLSDFKVFSHGLADGFINVAYYIDPLADVSSEVRVVRKVSDLYLCICDLAIAIGLFINPN